MKKVLLIALCVAIPMVGFAQKKKKKGEEPVVEAPVVTTLSDEECMTNLSLFHESVKNNQFEEAYGFWLPVYQSRPDMNKAIIRMVQRFWIIVINKLQMRILKKLCATL